MQTVAIDELAAQNTSSFGSQGFGVLPMAAMPTSCSPSSRREASSLATRRS